MLLSWAPDVLRQAGLQVVIVPGWASRSHGNYPDSINAVWHHDASPPGDSPGALNWMVSNWDNASANFWVDRQGTWHCVGIGVSWHAGRTLSGMPNNFTSFGVETDQTVGETPSQPMVDSVRRGMAALLKYMGRSSHSLHFHKTIASPVGRKSDPWFDSNSNNLSKWPDELARERNIVQSIMDGGGSNPVPPEPDKPPVPVPAPVPDEEDDMPRRIITVYDGNMNPLWPAFDGPTGVIGLQNEDEINCVNAIIDSDLMANTYQVDKYNEILSRGPVVTGVVHPPPVSTRLEHVVKKNETFYGIATANHLTVEQLAALNPQVKDPTSIEEGDVIYLS